MSMIFVGHSSIDNAPALALVRWLEENGWGKYFIDISADRGLVPGQRWEEALKDAADRCEAVIFLISPSWLDSRWCLAEFLLAKYLGKLIFGIVIRPTPIETLLKQFSAEWQLCDLVSGDKRQIFSVSLDGIIPATKVSFSASGLHRLKLGLQNAGIGTLTFPWPPNNDPECPPYRGLRALATSEAAIFFGRDADILHGLDALRRIRDRGTERMFVILGASGSGKSSFLRAGLWPRLKRDDLHFLPLRIVRPERAALTGPNGLYSSLEDAFRVHGGPRSRADIRKELRRPNGITGLINDLQRLARTSSDVHLSYPTVLLCVDQFEEAVSADSHIGAESTEFLDLLGRSFAATPPQSDGRNPSHPRLLVLVTIRSEAYERLQSHAGLASLVSYVFSLRPLDRAQFRQVIEGPLQRANQSGLKLRIQPQLTDKLLQDSQGIDSLPLLAFTLERLFVEYHATGTLSLENYQSLGGVQGSIELAVAAAFRNPAQEPAIPTAPVDRDRVLRGALIPWLVRVDPHRGAWERRVAKWADLPEPAKPLIERLVAARVISRDVSQDRSEWMVEISHEALLRQWPTLTTWIEEDKDSLKMLESVRQATAEWSDRGCNSDYLTHQGARLSAAFHAVQKRREFAEYLGESGLKYLTACKGQRQREEFWRIAKKALLSVPIVFVLWVVYFLANEWVLATANRRTAVSMDLIAQAAQARAQNREGMAVYLSLLASRVKPSREAKTMLATSLTAYCRGKRFECEDSETGFRGVMVKPSRRGSTESAIVIGPGQEKVPPESMKALPKALFGEPPERIEAGGEPLGDALLTPLSVTLALDDEHIRAAAFAPDGRQLLTGDSQGRLQKWDAVLGSRIGKPFQVQSGPIYDIAIDIAAQKIATRTDNGLRVWDTASMTLLYDSPRLDSGIGSPVFSSSGEFLAIVTDRGLVVLDAQSGRVKYAGGDCVSVSDMGVVGSVAFLRSEGTDLKLAATNGHAMCVYAGHPENLSFRGFNIPNSSMLAALDRLKSRGVAVVFDSKVHVFDLESGTKIGRFSRFERGELTDDGKITAFTLSPSGSYLGVGSKDGRLWLFDLDRNLTVGFARLNGVGGIRGIGFSADGFRMYTLSRSGDDLRIWNVRAFAASLETLQWKACMVVEAYPNPQYYEEVERMERMGSPCGAKYFKSPSLIKAWIDELTNDERSLFARALTWLADVRER